MSDEQTATPLLRFPEEIVLLLLDDESGKLANFRDWSLRYAMAGGVLMELALEHRVDSDLDSLMLVDETPTGDEMLDKVLAEIVAADEQHEVRYWVDRLSGHGDEFREVALDRLVEKGVLKRQEELLMWVFKSRTYPQVDAEPEREVKLRIMEVLFSRIVPDPRDVVIICLADACGIFGAILSERELEYCRKRIEEVRRLDIISQEVSKAIWDIDNSMSYAMMQPQGM